MNLAEWVLVVLLSVTLLVFLIVAIVLAVKLIFLSAEAKKVIETSQGIATKADDIMDNVKGMTSVGGIVKTFASHVIENQERRYAAEDAARAEAERAAQAANIANATKTGSAPADASSASKSTAKSESKARAKVDKVKAAVNKVKRVAKAAKES